MYMITASQRSLKVVIQALRFLFQIFKKWFQMKKNYLSLNNMYYK